MIKSIVTNWNFFRAFRLLLGIVIIVQALQIKDYTVATLGFLFSLMPLFNIGCCGVGNCATPTQKINNSTNQDVEYEEVI